MRMLIKYIDVEGTEEYVFPEKISARISANSAMELTLKFPNKSGKYNDFFSANDTLEVKEEP